MTSVPEDCPSLDVDPYAPEVLRDPYPLHERLREAGPVVHLARYGVWAVARYEQVRATLNRWEEFCSSAGAGLANFRKERPWRTPSLLLENDPPPHAHYRGVVTAALSRQALKELRPHFEAVAERLVDELVARRTFDAAPDLAREFPLRVFPDAVGIDNAGREHLLLYGDMAFNANELLQDAMSKAEPVIAYIGGKCRKDALRPHGLGSRIYEAADAGKVSESDAALLVRSLLTAGVDTTVSALSAVILLLAQPRPVAEASRESGARAVRVRRSDSTRVAGTDLLPDDDGRGAHRECAEGHVGFGTGIHACVGQLIARLEGEIILTLLATRVRSLQLTSPPTAHLNNTLRGWSSIPISVQAS